MHRVMRRRDHRPRPRNYTLPRCTESAVLRTWHITGELHTATVGTHAGSLRHTFRWDWDGMGHGSRALWVGSTHCTEYGVLSRTVLIIQDHCTEYHLRASHPRFDSCLSPGPVCQPFDVSSMKRSTPQAANDLSKRLAQAQGGP